MPQKGSGATTKATPAAQSAAGAKKPSRSKKARAAGDKAADAASSRFFKRAVERARRISDDPDKLREIAERAGRSSAMRSRR